MTDQELTLALHNLVFSREHEGCLASIYLEDMLPVTNERTVLTTFQTIMLDCFKVSMLYPCKMDRHPVFREEEYYFRTLQEAEAFAQGEAEKKGCDRCMIQTCFCGANGEPVPRYIFREYLMEDGRMMQKCMYHTFKCLYGLSHIIRVWEQ